MQRITLKYHFITYCLVVLLSQHCFGQFTIPEKPNLNKQTSVYDGAHILNTNQADFLEQKLIKYADSTSTQIVIATTTTLNGDDISLTATNWAHKWGVGQADKDNGIFILVATLDRKIDISTGYGIEYRLTDLMTERILNRIILPEFKRNDYFSGLDKGTNAIIASLNGEFEDDSHTTNSLINSLEPYFPYILFILFWIIISVSKYHGKNDNGTDNFGGGKRNRGLSPAEMIILSRSGRSTGSFGGGSFGGGGGFSGGFGGGGFGGGGASGGW
jgi:uncharacterized protein